MSNQKVTLELSSDAGLVFYNWLRRFNQNASYGFEDQAEQRVLWDIEAMLESALVEPFDAKYDELLAAARARVRDAKD
jgi:hypothetical protein